MKDLIIPIVFPDYKITINTPSKRFDVLPYFKWDNFKIKKSQQKVSNLGHAGILIINGRTGLTKYHEYGRYDPPEFRGLVRKLLIPDAETNQKGVILESLIRPLTIISKRAGNGGRIQGVLIEADGAFDKIDKKIKARKQKNNDPNRRPYSVTTNSCIHFVKKLVEAADKDTPWMVDPRPNSYIGEFRDDYRDLDFSIKTNTLKIEDVGEFQR